MDQIRANKDKKPKLNAISTPPKRKSSKVPKKGGFLDEIRNAKIKSKLKKARAVPKKKTVRMGMLDQIRSKAVDLAPVGERKLGKLLLPKKSHGNMMDQMKAMLDKVHKDVHGNSDDDDDSDSDWGSSDDE